MAYKRISPQPVVEGGTGASTLTGVVTGNGASAMSANAVTQYAVVVGGASNAVGSVASVGTSGQVLTSNGTGSNPTFQTVGTSGISSVVTQVFTSSGTYTPTSGMSYCTIECVGGGGGGGGSSTCSSTRVSVGAGGDSGVYARKVASSATVGASQTVTIGAGGTAGAVGGGQGGQGGTTSVGAICSADGGGGGFGTSATLNFVIAGGSAVSVAGGVGDLVVPNVCGGMGLGSVAGNRVAGGQGGASYFSGSNPNLVGSLSGAGNAALSYGGGGGGANTSTSGPQQPGAVGASGIVVITEFIA